MRRRVRWFMTAVAVALAGSGGFYVGTQFSEARIIQERVASGTLHKVSFLHQFQGELAEPAREAIASDLPLLVANLDAELGRPAILFVDYNQVKEARDRGLAYLKVYPPEHTASPGGRDLQKALLKLGFYINADVWKQNEKLAEAERRVSQLLEEFSPEKLDPESRRIYEELSAGKKEVPGKRVESRKSGNEEPQNGLEERNRR